MPPLNFPQLNELLQRLKRGDLDALDEIFAAVGRRMFALARGILKDTADAEDVLQECLIKIARAAPSFRDGSNGYAWIMRIVRNAAIDFLRRNKRTATEDLNEFFSLTDERYSEDRREEGIMLEDALRKLTEEERKIIYYRYYLDLTVRDAAKELGLSKSAAFRAIESAERRLKELLKEI